MGFPWIKIPLLSQIGSQHDKKRMQNISHIAISSQHTENMIRGISPPLEYCQLKIGDSDASKGSHIT